MAGTTRAASRGAAVPDRTERVSALLLTNWTLLVAQYRPGGHGVHPAPMKPAAHTQPSGKDAPGLLRARSGAPGHGRMDHWSGHQLPGGQSSQIVPVKYWFSRQKQSVTAAASGGLVMVTGQLLRVLLPEQ